MRRRLAAELRKDAGKTREQVAEFVGCSPVTVTRIESAQSAPRLADTARMLEFYGVRAAARGADGAVAEARKRGWRHQSSGAIPAWFAGDDGPKMWPEWGTSSRGGMTPSPADASSPLAVCTSSRLELPSWSTGE